jgi:WD40 repeat protein
MLPSKLKFSPGVAEAMALHKNGHVEWTGLAGLQPDGKTVESVMFSKVGPGIIKERRDSDSATLRFNGVPKLFFREADSKFFNKPGPELNAGTQPILCWSFSPDGRLLAIGVGVRDKQRLEGRWTDVSSGSIYVFEVPSGKKLMSTEAPHTSRLGAVSKIGFSEDSKTILYVADNYASAIY